MGTCDVKMGGQREERKEAKARVGRSFGEYAVASRFPGENVRCTWSVMTTTYHARILHGTKGFGRCHLL